MQRRTFVASVTGGLATLAGCLDASPTRLDDGTPSAEGSPSTTASPTDIGDPDGAADVTVGTVHLQYGFVTPTSPDSIGVANADTPYLVAAVEVDGSLSPDAFALRVGDERYAPKTIDRLYRTSWGDDEWYDRGRSTGLLLFEPPRVVSERLRLTWPGGELALDDGFTARLDVDPPQLSASLDLPGTHDGREAPPVEIEVTNGGDTPGRFVGAMNRVGPLVAFTPVTRLSRLVPPNDSERVTVSDSWVGTPDPDRIGDGDTDVRYHLDFGAGEDSAGIRLVDGE